MAEVDPSQSQEAPQVEAQTDPSSSQQTQDESQPRPWFGGTFTTEADWPDNTVSPEEMDWSTQGHEYNSVSWYDQPVYVWRDHDEVGP